MNKSFSKEAKGLIERLEGQGWTFRLSSAGHAIGRAPDGERTISIQPRLSARNRGYQNTLSEIKRWERDQEIAQGMADVVASASGPEVQALGRVVEALFASDDEVTDRVLARAADKHARKAIEEYAPEPATSLPRVIVGDVEPSSSTVEDRRPWKARMGSSRSKATTDYYESSTTDEVTYADGSKMYACRFEGCDFMSDRPRSVARHFGAKHTAQGESERVDASKRVAIAEGVAFDPSDMEPEHHHEYTPTERLVRALTEFMESAETLDAVAILRWFHDRPDLGDPEARVREPLTDTEIVAKIRLLVGGRDVELEAKYEDLLRRFDAVYEERDELSVRLGEVIEERDRLRTDLDAWLSLAPRPVE